MQENKKKEEKKNSDVNQKKDEQQAAATKWKSKLFGIIVLLILGFAANYFAGDSGQETGQNNYPTEAAISITPKLTLEAKTTPEISGELTKEDSTPKQGAENDLSEKDTKTEDNNKEDLSEKDTKTEDDNKGNLSEKDTKTEDDNKEDLLEKDTKTEDDNKEDLSEKDTKTEDDNQEDLSEKDTKTEDNNKEDFSEKDSEKEDSSDQNDTSEVEILYEFRRASYLEQHFEKHGAEFEYGTKEEYLAGANRVIQSPDALHKIEAEDGDDIYYIEETNEFVVVSTDGYIRTYFRPNAGIDYYNRQ